MRVVGFALLALGLTGCAAHHMPIMVVTRPVADLRAQPHTQPLAHAHDPGEETQLLLGEHVKVLATESGWAQVEALEQPEFSHAKKWQGYPGWVAADQLAPASSELEPNLVVIKKWAAAWRDPYRVEQAPFRLPLGAWLHGANLGGKLWRVFMINGHGYSFCGSGGINYWTYASHCD